MKVTGMYLFAVGLLATGMLFIGCSNPPATSTGNAQPASANSTDSADLDSAGHGDHGHKSNHDEAGGSAMEKMSEGLSKLSTDDRASAEQQHICPVSGEMLGSMGEPIKVTVKDQEVWICCDGCRKDLLAKPDEYLAKLKK